MNNRPFTNLVASLGGFEVGSRLRELLRLQKGTHQIDQPEGNRLLAEPSQANRGWRDLTGECW
ncbi:hypothetical protein [Aureliella helgolandensis]|uniref:hypothetical protein n=1 Tax=Aureliella helgolandensis TaxID=2527968 RepID=UPI0011A548EB|nr:hypothetical protein [Aureliella helgolandensis]